MKIFLFGATGMIGQGVLRECLRDAGVDLVQTIGRRPSGMSDPKLRETVHADLSDYSAIESVLSGFDACFFCLGVSSFRLNEADYTKVTYGLTMAAATTLARLNPGMVFVYVSGKGTDSSERGKSRWARVKGRAENALLRLPFRAAYMFRPGFIEPLQGIQSRTGLYRIFYAALAPVLPVLRSVFPNAILTTAQLGEAMLAAVRYGAPKPILEAADIRRLAALHSAATARRK